MKTKIAKLKRHFILCGYGRVGQEIAQAFSEEGAPFVIIDNDEQQVAKAEKDGYLCLFADATSDEVLKEAGIEQARGLVAAVGSDTDNTYITLSARGLQPDLFIAARCSSSEAEDKLSRAGADRVISPYAIGGRRMAMLALRPAVVDFIDTVTYRPRPGVTIGKCRCRQRLPPGRSDHGASSKPGWNHCPGNEEEERQTYG